MIQLLLNDPRIHTALEDQNGGTPLWYAACFGRREVIMGLIASGRDLGDVENKKGKHSDREYYTVLEIARREKRHEVVSFSGEI